MTRPSTRSSRWCAASRASSRAKARSAWRPPAPARLPAAGHARRAGERRTPSRIVDGAARGARACVASIERYEERLARALASVINVLDPDVIVLGGGLSNIARLYDEVPRRWKEYVFSDEVRTRLVAPVHGDAGGVRGAAWLWGDLNP